MVVRWYVVVEVVRWYVVWAVVVLRWCGVVVAC
jgi:hypothetical protein